jgi:ABC-type proline/glycine betaine transport system permease subunit
MWLIAFCNVMTLLMMVVVVVIIAQIGVNGFGAAVVYSVDHCL